MPLVELRTVNEIRYVTDSAGVAAFDEPGLMGQSVFFHVKSHGYEFPKDGFGYRGKALDGRPGGERRRSKIHRVNIAERLYRVTGGGIYRDTVLLGRDAADPRAAAERPGARVGQRAERRLPAASSTGSGATPTGRAIRWATSTSPGATSTLPGEGGSTPRSGVDLTTSSTRRLRRPTAQLPGDGPTWLVGLTRPERRRTAASGSFAGYAKIRPPMETYERGLVEFDPETHTFEKVATFPLDAPTRPTGHAFLHT